MKNKLNSLISILALLLLFGCNMEQSDSNTESSSKALPNIIYILADDLGYGDLSCYGQKKFSTPNIDKLAVEGILFTQHYSGSTVCAPSRSVLMTGQHTGHTYIRGNKEVRPEGQHPLPDSIFTLAEALKSVGYTTGAFGKWGLGSPGSEGDPTNQGFDTFFGYNCQRLGHHYYPYYLWSNRDSVILAKNAGTEKGTYAPELIHEKTLAFIENNKDKPFFLFVPSIIPHAELAAPEAFMEKYRRKLLPEKEYIGTDSGENFREGPYGSQSETHTAFAAMIDLLDQQVGEIVQKVDELGLKDNTLIIFTSDNGPHREGGADPEYFDSNGPLRGYKRDLYEGGIRVPMIARWPGKTEAGTETDHISAFWDVFPTFSSITGVALPDNTDGISFLPSLEGRVDDQKKHTYLYWEFHEKGGRIAARKGDWKAVKYNMFKNPDGPLELYNLEEDIGEENNVADKYPETVKEMEEIFRTSRTPSDVFLFSQATFLNSK